MTVDEFLVTGHHLLYSSENDGNLIVELAHRTDALRSQHQVYNFHVEPGSCAIALAATLVSNLKRVWSKFGTVLGSLQKRYPSNAFFLTCCELPLGPPFDESAVTLLDQMVFELLEFQIQYRIKHCILIMISSRRCVVAGNACIFVYDLPEFSANIQDHSPIAIAPVWKWKGDPPMMHLTFLQESPVFYEGWKSQSPMVWLLKDYRSLHFLKFSNSEDPVECHSISDLPLPGYSSYAEFVEVGVHRIIVCNEEEGVCSVSVLTLSDPSKQRAFNIELDTKEFHTVEGFSFDEASGRMCFVARKGSRRDSVFVVDTR